MLEQQIYIPGMLAWFIVYEARSIKSLALFRQVALSCPGVYAQINLLPYLFSPRSPRLAKRTALRLSLVLRTAALSAQGRSKDDR